MQNKILYLEVFIAEIRDSRVFFSKSAWCINKRFDILKINQTKHWGHSKSSQNYTNIFKKVLIAVYIVHLEDTKSITLPN